MTSDNLTRNPLGVDWSLKATIGTVKTMPLITRKIATDSIFYTAAVYNALDVSHFYRERIDHSTLFAQGKKSH